MRHRDAEGLVHRVVGEQDWTWENFLACDYTAGYRILEEAIRKTNAPVTCLRCLGFRAPPTVQDEEA